MERYRKFDKNKPTVGQWIMAKCIVYHFGDTEKETLKVEYRGENGLTGKPILFDGYSDDDCYIEGISWKPLPESESKEK